AHRDARRRTRRPSTSSPSPCRSLLVRPMPLRPEIIKPPSVTETDQFALTSVGEPCCQLEWGDTVRRPGVPTIGDMLVGREEELTALSVLLDGVRDGRGGALVLHGELGVGKSALLEAAAVAAAGRGVAVVRGLPAEIRSDGPTDERARYRLGLA